MGLSSFLIGLSKQDQTELRHRLAVADLANHICKEFKLSLKELSDKMNISNSMAKRYLTGAKNFTLKEIAALSAFKSQLETERDSNDLTTFNLKDGLKGKI